MRRFLQRSVYSVGSSTLRRSSSSGTATDPMPTQKQNSSPEGYSATPSGTEGIRDTPYPPPTLPNVLERDLVQEFSNRALKADGRENQLEALVWDEKTTYEPILLQKGQRNYYTYTDDIPQHVDPLYGDYMLTQNRAYFEKVRTQDPLWKRILRYGFIAAFGVTFWTSLVLAKVWIHQPREILQLREEILQNAYGKVLELGAGQGGNVGLYPYPAHEVWMMDQDEVMLRRLMARLPKTTFPSYHVLQQKVEDLENFPAASFDTVIDTFGLCHYNDPVRVLRQMQRIVKPTGIILLLEHGRTPYAPVNWFLDYNSERHQMNTHGCAWNKPIDQYITDSRLIVKEFKLEHYGTTKYVVAYPEQVT